MLMAYCTVLEARTVLPLNTLKISAPTGSDTFDVYYELIEAELLRYVHSGSIRLDYNGSAGSARRRLRRVPN
ncbi:hypothetical protein PGT21_022092 [Puccinia graminis f. sp. tritici]|uniref:Uncharacterized protein n=1 Tax=Puccinia graminis f. sp. tritici TaxID=56615 RepID=A0A5B0NP57_PUCGR|nr:hypothetical protein PGT21_022092 [Puccinia graminis f. sp. tritici]